MTETEYYTELSILNKAFQTAKKDLYNQLALSIIDNSVYKVGHTITDKSTDTTILIERISCGVGNIPFPIYSGVTLNSKKIKQIYCTEHNKHSIELVK